MLQAGDQGPLGGLKKTLGGIKMTENYKTQLLKMETVLFIYAML